jgi:hypothetical protein
VTLALALTQYGELLAGYQNLPAPSLFQCAGNGERAVLTLHFDGAWDHLELSWLLGLRKLCTWAELFGQTPVCHSDIGGDRALARIDLQGHAVTLSFHLSRQAREELLGTYGIVFTAQSEFPPGWLQASIRAAKVKR